MSCGIYKIENTENNKIYIGSSVNLGNREQKHFWMLRKNIHDNDYLQHSYNKYGKEWFIFDILEICTPEELIVKENFYIDKYNSNDLSFGYNLATVNEFRRNIFNNEVKVKLSKYNLEKNGNIYDPSYGKTEEEIIENPKTKERFYVDKYSTNDNDYFVAITPLLDMDSYFLSKNAWEGIKDKFKTEGTESDADSAQDINEFKKGL
jgi:group I intron endonuclease